MTTKIVKNEKLLTRRYPTMKRKLNELRDIVINAYFVIVDIYP